MDQHNKTLIVKKLLYKSQNRGCKENDLIVGKYAAKYLSEMSVAELNDFAAILEENDVDIYDWLVKKTKAPSHLNQKIIQQLINFDISK